MAVGFANMVVLFALDCPKFSFNWNAIAVSKIDCLARETNVLLKGKSSAINHNRRETCLDRLPDVVQSLAVIKVQCKWSNVMLRSHFGRFRKVLIASDLDIRRCNLDYSWHTGTLKRIHYCQRHLNVSRVIRGQHQSVLLGYPHELFHIHKWHVDSSKLLNWLFPLASIYTRVYKYMQVLCLCTNSAKFTIDFNKYM